MITPFCYRVSFAALRNNLLRREKCTISSDNFVATAFVNVDGRVAVVILNVRSHHFSGSTNA